jgi:hypothetical protein
MQRSSSAVIIVRSPKTIVCAKITTSLEKVFLIFDSRPRPSYPFGADLILNTSIDQAVARLQTLFPAVGTPLSESDFGRPRFLNAVLSHTFLSTRPAPSLPQVHRSHQHNSSPRSRYHPTAWRTTASFSCPICMDEHPMHNTVELDCNHQICRDCIRGHIRAKIEERRFPVFCPSCMGNRHTGMHIIYPFIVDNNLPSSVIERHHIQLIGVTEKEYAIWEEMELDQHSVLIHCRRCV